MRPCLKSSFENCAFVVHIFFLAFVTGFSDNSREEMELTDLTSVSCKLTDENKERLAKEKNKEIQLDGESLQENCGS